MTRKEMIARAAQEVRTAIEIVDDLDLTKFRDLDNAFNKIAGALIRAHDLLAKIEQEADE